MSAEERKATIFVLAAAEFDQWFGFRSNAYSAVNCTKKIITIFSYGLSVSIKKNVPDEGVAVEIREE